MKTISSPSSTDTPRVRSDPVRFRRLYWTICIIVYSSIHVFAGDTLVAPVGDMRNWVVEYHYTNPPPAGASEEFLRFHARPRKMESTVKGGIWRIQFSWESGLTSEHWFFPEIAYYSLKQEPSRIMVIRGEAVNDRPSGIFPDTSWIRSEYHAGRENAPGTRTPCDLYRETAPDPDTGKIRAVRSAWIDVETRLPVRQETLERVETYRFSRDVPDLPELPPAFQKMAEHQ